MNGDHSLPADFRGIIEECGHRAMDEDIEGVPEWERFRVISDELGTFLFIVARSSSRMRICELAGPGGASSSILWLAGAARTTGGEVVAWETNPRRFLKLQNSLSRARLSPKVLISTSDPMWPIADEGHVIAPPSIVPFDLIIVSLTEPDWHDRMIFAWDNLEPGGLLVLVDTFQAGESVDTLLAEFFSTNPAAVVGCKLSEGFVIAYKLSDRVSEIDTPSESPDLEVPTDQPDIMIVGEKAHEVLLELQDENRKPGSRLWAIPPITGKFLWTLLMSMKATNVLEIGASAGYSGTWIASALRQTGGHLTTLEFDPEKVKRAGESYERAGVSDIVTLIEGDALEILPTLGEKYDLVFLDCSKEFYRDLLEPILWRLKRGGLLVADNVISHMDELKGYLEDVKHHPNLASVTIPIGSGEELTMVI